MAPGTPQGTSPLRRVLHATEYFTLAIGSMIGVGWLILIDDWLKRGGPMGAMLGFLVGGVALLPVAWVYGRLTERMPDADSEIAYTGAVFGRAVSFVVGWMMVLAYLIVCPWEAVAIGQLAAYLFPALNTIELYQVAGYPVYLPHLILGLALTAAITALNHRGIYISATFQNLAVLGLVVVFAVCVVLGLVGGTVANLAPLFAQDQSLLGGLVATLMVLQVAPYFLTGFETVPKCSEEAAIDFNPRGFLPVILLALIAGTLFYVGIIGVVASLQPWPTLIKERFATAVAFERAFGSPLLVQFLVAGALLSLVKVYNGNFLAATRLLFALGRRKLLSPQLGRVHARFGTPTWAILVAGLSTALVALLGRAVLIPITEVGSFAATVGWLATCLAFCWGAGGVAGGATRAIGWWGALATAALIVLKILPWVPGCFQAYEYLILAGWLALGVLLCPRRPLPY